MEATTLRLDSTDISLLQLLATVVGGVFALYLLTKANKEKRYSFVLNVYDKLYGDNDMIKILYAADKGKGLEKLKDKVDSKNQNEVDLEKETDKVLRYFDFVGALLKSGQLKPTDLTPFQYELKTILENEIIKHYITYLKATGVNFENLDYLLKYI